MFLFSSFFFFFFFFFFFCFFFFFFFFFFFSERARRTGARARARARASNLPPARRARSVLSCAACAFCPRVRDRTRRVLCFRVEKRREEVVPKRKWQDQEGKETVLSAFVVVHRSVVARRRRPGKKKKKKRPISSPLSFPLSLSFYISIRILIPRWGPVISEDPLKRRQVVYLSERVSSRLFFVLVIENFGNFNRERTISRRNCLPL